MLKSYRICPHREGCFDVDSKTKKRQAFCIVITVLLSLGFAFTSSIALANETLRARIDAFHEGAPANGEALKVVYFHPSDRRPQSASRERLTRVMVDIQEFIRSEMERNGYGAKRTFPLEMDENGELRIHLVAGAEEASGYDYQSGDKIVAEIRKALPEEEVDIDHDFVMIFHGLVDVRGENDYFFYAPYYGDGSSNQVRGLCHAADCEILDPRHFTDMENRMRYEEHTGTFKQTWGEFNTKYIGGVAHELGHGLSLPHNREEPGEKRERGNALMGAGNHTYRDELRGGKGSFLSAASAVRLACHPLFTGSDRERETRPDWALRHLAFSESGGELTVTGEMSAAVEPFAVIAYADPDGGSNYDARTGVAEVVDGKFTVRVVGFRKGKNALRIAGCLPNGAVLTRGFPVEADAQGVPDVVALNGALKLQEIAEVFMNGNREGAAVMAKEFLPEFAGSKAGRKLEHVVRLAGEAVAPVDLATVTEDAIFLSEVKWEAARMGYGQPARDQYFCNARFRDALFLEIDGEFFERGLYAHAPSRYTFALGKGWKTLEATAGLQEGAVASATAVFVVKGDGVELFRGGVMEGKTKIEIAVDVTGVETLELIAETGQQGNAGCWSVWGGPRVSR